MWAAQVAAARRNGVSEEVIDLLRAKGDPGKLPAPEREIVTVTRVNAAAPSTGTQPGTNGVLGNRMYLPAVDPGRAFDTGDYRNLRRVDHATGGRLLLVRTLAERLQAHGRRLAAVGSGSTGSAFLLNPRAPSGVGTLVNGYLDPGRTVAHPAEANAAILHAFGPAPVKGAPIATMRRSTGRSGSCASTCCPSSGLTS